MITVKKIEIKEQYIGCGALPGYTMLVSEPLEILISKYINDNSLTKETIINISILEKCAYIIHINKK